MTVQQTIYEDSILRSSYLDCTNFSYAIKLKKVGISPIKLHCSEVVTHIGF